MQHPTPPQIDYDAALLEVDPDKDVDGMHPVNVGRLALSMPGPVPCTPAGIEALLAFYEIPVAGREVCILGRGATLGRPLAMLLSQKRPTANAAVTVVHTGVPDWPRYTQRADIVVAAAGVPGILQPEHITPGAVVVGGGVRYEGKKLLPDVDERCEEVAGLHHAAGRRRRPDHDRDAVPQRRRSARSGSGRGARSVSGLSRSRCADRRRVDGGIRCPDCNSTPVAPSDRPLPASQLRPRRGGGIARVRTLVGAVVDCRADSWSIYPVVLAIVIATN